MDERVKELDLGVTPDAGSSLPLLIQTEPETWLLFAVNDGIDWETVELPIGDGEFGAARFEFCVLTKFGYPNDEGMNEHPLFDKGLRGCKYCISEVEGSRWVAEYDRMTMDSTQRIGKRKPEPSGLRHFIVSCHDSTFECLAKDIKAERRTGSMGEFATELASRLSLR